MEAPSNHGILERLLQHDAWLRGLARALLDDVNDVDDLLQEVWQAAVQAPRLLRSPSALSMPA